MKKQSLCGEWKIKNLADGNVVPATVPGSDFGNLIKAGVIANPLISGKEEEGIRTAENEYLWSRTFTVGSEIAEFANVTFECDCLDTLCTCRINGQTAFRSENAYLPVSVDVKSLIREGENEIEIQFDSPVKFITEKQKENALPANSNGIDGIPYIRKPGCHFGWDWGPCVPYCYIGNAELAFFNRRIENIAISQQTDKEKSVVTVKADNADNVCILTPQGEKLESENGVFEIVSPELWYTRELSLKDKQPLYTVVFTNDEETVERKIGLRSLYLDRSKDEYGEDFCFVINGEKVFSKGGNLIPFSAIPEDADESDVDYYLNLAVKSNFNIIRVWGGGSYASEYLMNRCDELGLLVWQDFCFACQLYPLYDDKLRNSIIEEVKSNVSRLAMHPSLAVLCGNNEIETMFFYMPRTSKLMKAYHSFFYGELPETVSALTDTSYIPSSPIGDGYMKNISSDNYGDTHMWNVWHGLKKLDYYQQRYSRFLSEFGLESLPSMKSIKTFATKEKDYDIESEAFNSHQKCKGGNRKMLFYLTEMFDFPEKFESLPYLTGIVQAECIKNATVHFRQNKGRCNGSIFWQYNDVWNCPSWSSVDFEKVPKALQYKSKEFFDPVTMSCKKEKGKAYIYAHNDTLFTQTLEGKIKLYSLDGKLIKSEDFSVTLEKNSQKPVREFSFSKKTVCKIEFGDKAIYEIFDKPSSMNLRKAKISAVTEGNKLKVTADTFAYNIFLDCEEVPEENYFSLLPGEEKIIEFTKPPVVNGITCCNNISFKKNELKKKIFRIRYFLRPENIANYLYYSRT